MCMEGVGDGGKRGGGKQGADIYKVPEFNRAIVSIRKIWSATEQKSVNLKKKGGVR